MSNWHYNAGGTQRGPITIDELKAKIVAGYLSRNSLVWRVGTPSWDEVRNFPELIDHVQVPPPLPKSVTVVAGTRTAITAITDALPVIGVMLPVVALFFIASSEASKNNAWFLLAAALSVAVAIALAIFSQPKKNIGLPSHAWRRLAAKFVDVELACVVGTLGILMVSPSSMQGRYLLFLILVVATLFLFEVPMKGASLGRYLFGVHLSPIAATETTSDWDYFTRFAKLSFFGMALGFPILSAIAHAIAYKRLRETGSTKWDENQFAVTYMNSTAVKATMGVVLLLVLAIAGNLLFKEIATRQSQKPYVYSHAPISAPTDTPQREESAGRSQAKSAFWPTVDMLVPDFATINRNPKWIEFLDSKPDYAEQTYRELVEVSIALGKADKVANLVTLWKSRPESSGIQALVTQNVPANKFWAKVIDLVPDWKKIDKDENWMDFLETTPSYTEKTYRGLIEESIKKGHPQKVAKLVELWRAQSR